MAIKTGWDLIVINASRESDVLQIQVCGFFFQLFPK